MSLPMFVAPLGTSSLNHCFLGGLPVIAFFFLFAFWGRRLGAYGKPWCMLDQEKGISGISYRVVPCAIVCKGQKQGTCGMVIP